MEGVSSIRLQGTGRLISSLKKAGGSLQDMKEIHRQVGGIVTPVAKAATPIGPPKGGHIRTTVRFGVTSKGVAVRAGTGKGGRFPYGPQVHWGWRKRGVKSNPWISEAAQATEGRWNDVYMQGIEKVLDKIEGARPNE